MSLLALVILGCLSIGGCAKDEASPTEQACDRLLSIRNRVDLDTASLPVIREEFASAWNDAARDPQSPVSDPIDRVIGLIDSNTTGYLLPADRQHMVNQLSQIAQACSSA